MAIDKKLQIFDENGNSVDYDILANDVKFLPDGKDLPTKLAEMEEEIGEGGYTPPAGGIPKTDLAQSVQTSLGKADTALQAADKTQLQAAINAVQTALNALIGGNVQGAIDTFNEVTAFLDGIDTSDPTLKNQLLALNNAITALQTALAGKVDKVMGKGLSTNDYTTEEKTKLAGLPTNPVQSISVNGQTPQTPTNGNVNIQVQAGDQVSVIQPDPADGTFIIRVGSTDYTINLNHTHPNMCKLIVCEESDLPSTLDNSTIYAITDSGETEIEKLIIRGMEFVGGGVPDTGEPMITSPSNGSTINLGDNTSGQGVSKTITIKGKHLTGDLTVAVGTGLTISYGQSTGQSSVTIPMAQALLGAQVTIAYSGSGALDDGSLVISHGNDVLSSVVVVVAAVVQLTAIKLTGTQWGQTDYNVNVNTKVSMRLKFTENANTIAGDNSNKNYYFLTAYTLSSASKQFAFYAYKSSSTGTQLLAIVPTTPPTAMNIPTSTFLTDDSLFEVGLQSMKFTPNGGTAITTSIGATQAMDKGPLTIGLYHSSTGTDSIFNWYDLTIYELTITENNVVKRHYTPVTRNGVPGLLDSETGHFMSSETAKTSGLASDEFVAIPLS